MASLRQSFSKPFDREMFNNIEIRKSTIKNNSFITYYPPDLVSFKFDYDSQYLVDTDI